MILTLMIIPPVSFAISSALFGPPIFFGRPGMHPEGFGPGFGREFASLHFVPNLIFLIWLGVGIRQWYVLSKWSKKYQRYKELQKKLDEKLDYDNNEG